MHGFDSRTRCELNQLSIPGLIVRIGGKKKIGMTIHGTFTYGLPGETPPQMVQTKNYIASLPFDSVISQLPSSIFVFHLLKTATT